MVKDRNYTHKLDKCGSVSMLFELAGTWKYLSLNYFLLHQSNVLNALNN